MADTSEINRNSEAPKGCNAVPPAGPKDQIRRLAHRPPPERFESAGTSPQSPTNHSLAHGLLQAGPASISSDCRKKPGHMNRKQG